MKPSSVPQSGPQLFFTIQAPGPGGGVLKALVGKSSSQPTTVTPWLALIA